MKLPLTSAPWMPDCGDGTYRNPILHADYSDPDAIRVGDDYWLTASSFNHAPGLPILHSCDLVNWTLVNHALPALTPAGHFSTPRHGEGVWAPAIRHHAGKFWIYYPDPDFGLYAVTADDPRDAWSEPVLVLAGQGLIDPCPFWDDDGQGWLVHAWARSRAGIANLLTLRRLSADGFSADAQSQTVIDGNRMPGWNTIEGPKLHKRAGWYYLFAPAGGVGTGWQAVFRSRDLVGPYEGRIVLAQGATRINGPHQGAWVDTPRGEHWFLHFQEMPAYGRVVHLQPMHWRDDGWPEMGVAVGPDGKGEPVLAHRKPAVPESLPTAPATTDWFDGPALSRQWQWQANPRPEWSSLTAAPGALRLACVPLRAPDSHWLAAHLLLQKFPAPEFTVTTILRFSPMADGDTAGLIIFGHDYAWLSLRQGESGLRLMLVMCHEAHKHGREQEIAALAVAGNIVHLRASIAREARCRFAYSLDDGQSFLPLSEEFRAVSGHWVGAKVGLFASAAYPAPIATGWADFTRFELK